MTVKALRGRPVVIIIIIIMVTALMVAGHAPHLTPAYARASLSFDDVVMTSTDLDEAAAWAPWASEAAWTVGMTAALASLPDDDEPGYLTDEIVEAFISAVIATSYANEQP